MFQFSSVNISLVQDKFSSGPKNSVKLRLYQYMTSSDHRQLGSDQLRTRSNQFGLIQTIHISSATGSMIQIQSYTNQEWTIYEFRQLFLIGLSRHSTWLSSNRTETGDWSLTKTDLIKPISSYRFKSTIFWIQMVHNLSLKPLLTWSVPYQAKVGFIQTKPQAFPNQQNFSLKTDQNTSYRSKPKAEEHGWFSTSGHQIFSS